MSMRCVICSGTCALLVISAHSQSFDIEQFEQIFRPRVKLDARYQPTAALQDTTDRFGFSEGTAVFTFPIRSRFDASLKLDTAAHGLGELLKKSVRVKASQLLGSARFTARQVEIGFDSLPQRQLHSRSIGLMGVKLTKKYRVLFWSANVNLSEEDRTFDAVVPRFNGVIGQMHVKGLRRNFYYGLAIGVSDRLVFPLPFIGGTTPMGDRWSFQYLLPAQVAVGYKPQARTKFTTGITLDGFRSGLQWQGERTNMNYGGIKTFLNVRHKANRHLQVRADVGYALAHTLRFSGTDQGPERYAIEPGLSFGIGVNVLFGASTLERIMDEVVR